MTMSHNIIRLIIAADFLGAISLALGGCSVSGPAGQLAKFTGADVTAAAVAADAAGDTIALNCFRPMAAALGDGATLPGAATLIEADRLCKGILPVTFP